MAAAEASENAKVIGVDVDQSSESETVITSAMKMLSNSVYAAVESAYNGEFKGGETAVFDIMNDGVGIAMDTAKWNSFTSDDYDAIYVKLASGQKMRGNFFICGDKTEYPHYGMWNGADPAVFPKPDFHQPVNFAPMVLE